MMIEKRQAISLISLISMLILLPACWPFDKVETEKRDEDLYVINVLDKESYEDCRIAGSINVPFDEVENFAKNLNRKSEVVVYCANYMCSASMSAAQKLKEMGFENVWAYEGGTAEWYQLGLKAEGKYPIEGTCQASYLSAANERTSNEPTVVPIINADELHEKMVARGKLSTTVANSGEEAPQAAA